MLSKIKIFVMKFEHVCSHMIALVASTGKMVLKI